MADYGLAEDMYGLNYYRHNSSEVGESTNQVDGSRKH